MHHCLSMGNRGSGRKEVVNWIRRFGWYISSAEVKTLAQILVHGGYFFSLNLGSYVKEKDKEDLWENSVIGLCNNKFKTLVSG